MEKGLYKSLQDIFSSSIDVPVYSIDTDGNIIAQSKEFPFFCQLIRSKGDLCRNCALDFSQKLKNSGEDVIHYSCHAGLHNIMFPLKVQDQIIGSLVCSSMIKDELSEQLLEEVAEVTKIEVDELIDALEEVHGKDEVEIKHYEDILMPFAKTIPSIVYVKTKSDKKLEQLEILRRISQTLNSTDALNKSADIVRATLKRIPYIESCSIVAKINDETKRITGEPGREEIDKVVSQQVKDDVIRIKKAKDNEKLMQSGLKMPCQIIALPLSYHANHFGAAIFYVYAIDEVSDMNFLWVIADQIAMALTSLQSLEAIKSKAITDKLTGLYNREFFMKMIEMEVGKAAESKKPISVALIDLDDFKHYNDHNGHIKGDELLKSISTVLKTQVRPQDIVGRYGGEEFIIICPDTNSVDARSLMESIREKVQSIDAEGKDRQPLGCISISTGIITCFIGSTPDDLIKKADMMLYKAKELGKNRVRSEVIIDKNIAPVDVNLA